jgi:HrpA-like RNA helicase
MGGSISQHIKEAEKYISEHFEYADKSLRFLVFASATGIGAYWFRTELGQMYYTHIRSENYKRKQGAKKLMERKIVDEKPNYVPRKDLEKTLEEIMNSLGDEKYVILVGPKGSGKTTLLNHIVNGKEGIVMVKIAGETTPTIIKRKLIGMKTMY